MTERAKLVLSRRACLPLLAAAISATCNTATLAQGSSSAFDRWVAAFRARALARGIIRGYVYPSDGWIKPDAAVFELNRAQPEFTEQLWQYLNRRVSDWRIVTGKEKAKEHAPLLARIERDYGVDRSIMLGLWGIESAFGDPVVQKNHMRPVIPALAALAWGEPRRRAYWEQELINALRIIDRGWSTPAEMRGSWAGAMGHTQWMPEVWLNVGVDYDGDGRISPFGNPDDAFAGTAQYLIKRGKYRRGEHWGYEVRGIAGKTGEGASRTYEAWQKAGVIRADGQPFPQPNVSARLWVPVAGGPAFLLGPNFYAVRIVQSFDELYPFHRAYRRPDHGRRPVRTAISRRRAYADPCRSAGNSAASDCARLQYRGRRRPRRQCHHDRGAQFPAPGRDRSGRRLCRREAAGAVAPGALIRFYGACPAPLIRTARIIP